MAGSIGVARLAGQTVRTRKCPSFKAFQTVKLSPQPHSPRAFGFSKRKLSFSPWRTKSMRVPSIAGRLAASTNNLTPRDSNTSNFEVLDLLVPLTQMMVEGELLQLERIGRIDV